MSSKYFKKNKRNAKNLTKNIISVNSQLERLKSSFPDLKILVSTRIKFEIIIKLKPDVFSREYEVKIIFERGNGVSVFIVNEKLKIAENRTKLPHVWDNEKQKICLYSKVGGRWSDKNSIVSTIIPWASEWLYFYELWLIDGNWYGGGHNEYLNEKLTKNIKDE